MSQLKSVAKSITRGVFKGLALPEVALFRLVAMVDDEDEAFHHASQTLSLVPGRAGIYLRAAFYQMTLEACADDACITFGSVFSHRGTRIGSRVYIGLHGNVGLCEIGDDVLFGSDVHILSGKNQHYIGDPDRPINSQGGSFERVRIGRNSWIGNGARVLADVGEGCVVGAGSVVTAAVPDWSIAVGNPAKVVKQRK